ncbi:ribonuclease activity regulator RraA [Nereida sp. MMG025]|uniref:ribonuclease activity regulator RraA n=1 Tax=Nereida sp. MMG025 TaxID=2909981 RepID=UPI001F40EC77|nr:ribonuclease activity regulator RraA [Nereida sp. MMG025]MCF6443545.1 ribonuclease activity regulator RraA [Nereida sp. MMG025]
MTHSIDVSDETIAALRNCSTATIATLLYKHGIRNAFVQGVGRLGGGGKPRMVGPAFTLRYMAAREDTDQLTEFRKADHPQRKAIETCPEGHVLVMDCRQDATAASAGSILLTRLQVRGGEGVVTDGGVRDADGAGELEMPVYAAGPSALTNLTKHHAVDINVPVSCGTCPVYPGDIVVGDGDGVMVIPRHMAKQIAEEGAPMELYEDFVLEQVNSGAPIIGLYPATDPANLEKFEEWKTKNGH